MTETAQKCVAAARNVAEGSPTLGKLIRGGKDPMQAKVLYEYGAVLRTLVEELQYYNFAEGEDWIIDARKIYDLADAIENL
jgi:hypothetical protein